MEKLIAELDTKSKEIAESLKSGHYVRARRLSHQLKQFTEGFMQAYTEQVERNAEAIAAYDASMIEDYYRRNPDEAEVRKMLNAAPKMFGAK